jgi:hypothetical protein
MKKYTYILFLLVCFTATVSAFGQTDKVKLQVDSLKYVTGDAFDCSSLVWRIVATKQDAIQILIDKLSDTTLTKATYKCTNTFLRVGDLAYLALDQILPLPFFSVTGMQCDVIENGCQVGVFTYIETNRKKFNAQVQKYYDIKKNTMEWIQFDSNHLIPCRTMNNVKGYYKVSNK